MVSSVDVLFPIRRWVANHCLLPVPDQGLYCRYVEMYFAVTGSFAALATRVLPIVYLP